MSLQFDPLDAYYVVGDHNPTTEVFSTASSVEAYVANNAVAYLAWLTAGNFNFYTTIVSAADNGAGLVRLTLTGGSSLATGQRWRVNGSASYDGNYQITKISTNVIDLVGSTYTGDSVENANLQGAAIVATQAELWLNFDNYAQAAFRESYGPFSTSVDLTLTSPVDTLTVINETGTSKKVILPNMRSPRAPPIGRTFSVKNSDSSTQSFTLYKADGSTAIRIMEIGDRLNLVLTDNSTTNGTFEIDPPAGAAGLSYTAWTLYTPTVTAETGSLTTVSTPLGYYKAIGKTVFLRTYFAITNNGTGAGAFQVTTPPGLNVSTNTPHAIGAGGRPDGAILKVRAQPDPQNFISIKLYDGTYPFVSPGDGFYAEVTYETT